MYVKAPKAGAPLFLRLVTPAFSSQKISHKLRPAKKNVFILSTGRTGTVYISSLLDQVGGVISAHEPKPSRVLNAWTTAFLEGKISDEYMASALYAKRKRLAGVDKDIYVEMNNFIAGFAGAAEQVFENASVIHVVRDPRDFITSLTNRGDDNGIRKLFNKYVPYWAFVPKGVKKRELTALTRAAYRWVAINEYLSDWGKTHPDKYQFFKFEDLFDRSDPRKLDPLLSAVGLSKSQIARLDYSPTSRYKAAKISLLDRPIDASNTSSRLAMAKWPGWSEQDKKTVAKICGQLMRKYGYGGEPKWTRAR